MVTPHNETVVQGTWSDVVTAIQNAEPGATVTIHEKSDGSAYQPTNDTTPVEINKDLTIVGSGDVRFDWDDWAYKYLFVIKGSKRSTESLDSDTQAGGTYDDSSDQADHLDYPASLTVPGDLNVIHDDAYWSSDNSYHRGESHVVQDEAENGDVRVEESLIYDYLTSRNAKVEVIEPVEFHLKNVELDGPSAVDKDIDGDGYKDFFEGIKLKWCKDSTLENVTVRNCSSIGLQIDECYNIDITDSKFEKCKKDGIGYGVVVYNASAHVSIKDSHLNECRHGLSVGTNRFGQSRNVSVEDCVLGTSTLQILDAHPTCESLHVQNCHFQLGTEMPLFSGARYTSLERNQIFDSWKVNVRGNPPNPVFNVENNTFVRPKQTPSEWSTSDQMNLHRNNIVDTI
ncbi:right-handed parallel beta-helix repeat-containing protein [Halobium salinum]|uniref:Right-handed parallel beta-helix repeat-containing protein n=1 Tax=Halobium salinum TaxID=1364940 RepID=A0ABD5PEU7_9EURY|nr:right-handed parallel beta-helix repeat-containing protein [Halobium salinum]